MTQKDDDKNEDEQLTTSFRKFIEPTDEITTKEIVKDLVKFLISLAIGTIVDIGMYYIQQGLGRYQTNKFIFTALAGNIQIVINLIILSFFQKHKVGGALTVTGLFIPQTFIIKHLYRINTFK